MIFIRLISFLLLCAGTVLLLRITPEDITGDLLRLISPKASLKETVMAARGKKKTDRLAQSILHTRTALTVTGNADRFTAACAASLVLMVLGCIAAILIDNWFLIPVFAAAFAALPFLLARSAVRAYDKRLHEELETALSIVTTSYIRTDDIIAAVEENLSYLAPPVRDLFTSFAAETKMVSSDCKQALRNMKGKLDNAVFSEWCEALIACQDDRTLKDTLLPIVSKLTDIRIVNTELKTVLDGAKKEYGTMVCLVIGNIPLMYLLNRDWYDSLMVTTAGKIVLALCGAVILITAVLLHRFTQPVEYKR